MEHRVNLGNGNYAGRYGLKYSVIDIQADGGRGDLIETQKNVKLLDDAVEKMITINHSNKTDVWLVAFN
jgi:hypothetical protein